MRAGQPTARSFAVSSSSSREQRREKSQRFAYFRSKLVKWPVQAITDRIARLKVPRSTSITLQQCHTINNRIAMKMLQRATKHKPRFFSYFLAIATSWLFAGATCKRRWCRISRSRAATTYMLHVYATSTSSFRANLTSTVAIINSAVRLRTASHNRTFVLRSDQLLSASLAVVATCRVIIKLSRIPHASSGTAAITAERHSAEQVLFIA